MSPSAQPLIITLRLDSQSMKLLTNLRTRFFPQQVNHLYAHITLFHALPSTPALMSAYQALFTGISNSESKFAVGLKEPFMLGKRGKGVAIRVKSFKARELRETLQDELHRLVAKHDRENGEGARFELTEQDSRRGFRPHVTVMNKVEEEAAQSCLKELNEGGGWEERAGKAEGLSLWRYEVGGSWIWLEDFVFR